MTFAELLSALLGWLGEFVKFVFSFVPRIRIIKCNQKGVRYCRGDIAEEVNSGVHWYWPWCTEIVVHWTARDCFQVPPISVETKDGIRIAVGVSVPYQIIDVVKYDAENTNADQNIIEAAQAGLRDIVTAHTLVELSAAATEDSRFGGKLARRMGKDLEPFGVQVLACRPTDMVRIDRVFRHFGLEFKLEQNSAG